MVGSAERPFQAALSAARMGAWVWEFASNAVWWSDAVAEIFGLEPGAFTGTYDAYLELVPEEQRGEVLRAIDDAVRGGSRYFVEHRVANAAISERWVRARGDVLRDAEGKPLRLVGVVLDVTDQKLAARRMQENEERFRAFAEASFEGIAFTLAGRIVDINSAAARMLGYAPEELVGRLVRDLVAPEDRDLVAANLAKELSGPYEHRAIRKDGSQIVVEASGGEAIYRGASCRITALRDVTERKRAEERLRRSDEMIRAIVETSRDWIWAIDLEGRHTYSNPAIEAILGYRPEEMGGVSAFELLHAEDSELIAEALPQWIESKKGWSGLVLRWRHKDGSYRYLESSSVPILDASGALTGFRGVDRDVTDRKGMMEENRRLEEQLRHSQRLEAVGQLAGGIAHDFNNLLTVILGNLEVVKDQVRGSEDQEGELAGALRHVEQSAKRAAKLTGQLLTFSRRQVSMPQDLNLNEVLGEMEEMLGRLVTESIALRIDLAEPLDNVRADPGLLQQVVINLVVNARDAMPQGGALTLRTSNWPPPREVEGVLSADAPTAARCVVLEVSDTGHGMDKETSRRVFDPFFTTKEPGKGTGLGLSTVYGIVTQAGGCVDLESEPGQGSVFRIYLPVSTKPPAPTPTSGTTREAPRGSETVLVCEDDARVRRITSLLLEQSGYKVLEAEGGAQALDLIAGHPGQIHLLLTDMIMPDMNGLQLVERVRLIEPGIQSLLCSGYPSDSTARGATMTPGITFLPKPFSRLQLLVTVRELLDGAAT